MTEIKETFGEKLLKFWYLILANLGLCTTRARDKAIAEITDRTTVTMRGYDQVIEDYEAKLAEYEKNITDLKEQALRAKERYDETYAQMLRYRDDVPIENVDMIKNLQSQIHDIYATSRNFGFPNSIPMAGSVSMSDSGITVNGDNFVDLMIRMITLDEETVRINQETDQRRRYALMVNYLKQRGLLEKIGERMISSGAATLAIAYNHDCTTYEIFAEMTAKVLPDAGTIRDHTKEE